MKRILDEIQSGNFAKEWILENRAGRPSFNALARRDENHLIEQVGGQLRAMMSWVSQRQNAVQPAAQPETQKVQIEL